MRIFSLDGINITSSTRGEIKEYLRRTLSGNSLNQLWITFNLDFFRIASENNEFKNICEKAHLVLPDGNGILHLIKAVTGKKAKRITGNDILDFTLHLSNNIKIKAAFVGSREKVLNKLVSKIQKEYPSLEIVSAVSPPFNFENDEEYNSRLVSDLANASPDILFLAIGCPRQELWLNKHKEQIGAKINIGVGGAFDFFTGHKKRSPRFLQEISMEWFWRLIHEPKRLSHRYLVKDFPFFIKKMIHYKFNNAK